MPSKKVGGGRLGQEVKPATLTAQALGWTDTSTRALVPPLVASVPYERAADGTYPGGHTYSRDQNPTYDQAEALLARLDGGAWALLFSSGMAAATTLGTRSHAGRWQVGLAGWCRSDRRAGRTRPDDWLLRSGSFGTPRLSGELRVWRSIGPRLRVQGRAFRTT